MQIWIKQLACDCSVGIYAWEKLVKQRLLLSIELQANLNDGFAADNIETTVDYKALSVAIRAFAASQHFGLIERLVLEATKMVLDFDTRITRATVTIDKGRALRHAHSTGVTLTLTRHKSKFVIGLGSNIDPSNNINIALGLLHTQFNVIGATAQLQTAPVGVENQPDYINTAVAIISWLDPILLKQQLRAIEVAMGRNTAPTAPRIIDLDILTYNNTIVNGDVFERPFLQKFIAELSQPSLT